jgi:DNA-binding beta-propeller fold protein YncE
MKQIGMKQIGSPGVRHLAAAALLALAAIPAQAAEPAGCGPADGAQFICGVNNVEDFAPVPGTQWVIGSDLALPGKQGYFYVFDTKTRAVTTVQPGDITVAQDKQKYGDCAGPPDWKVFGPHGLDLTRGSGAHRTLYVVNHGGREAVEVFDVDLSKGKPGFAWTGCVVAPKGFWPDAVASLPDGGFVATSLWDPSDNQRLDKLMNGRVVGGLSEWHEGKGWTPLPGADKLSGPNGVIVSPDGKDVYVAVWSGKQIARITRGEGAPRTDLANTGFLTDNLRWAPDGRNFFAGGQAATVKDVLGCFESTSANCPQVPFSIDEVDPKTLKLTPLIRSIAPGGMGAGTGAIEVGHDLWISTFRGDRIAIMPIKR